MNKHALYLVLLIGLLLTGCQQKNEPPEVKNRTVIVYINADNNLYYNALTDINEMELGWRDEEYRHTTLLVYINSAKSGGKQDPPMIYRIRHDGDRNKITSQVVHQYQAHNASDSKILSQVLNDAMSIAPAQNYGLVLWSHGTGWVPMNVGQPLRSAGRGEDIANYTFGGGGYTYAGSEMEVYDLVKALPAGVVFDYIAFDACYMGGIEVAYELRNNCRRFIGSSIETPSPGFNYELIMNDLITANAEGIIKKHYEHCSKKLNWEATVAISSIDCSQLDALAAATKLLLTNNPKSLSDLSTIKVQDFGSTAAQNGKTTFMQTYFDLLDFVEHNWTPTAEFTAFKNALTATVCAKYHLPKILGQENLNTYSGYSCYVPKASQPKALAAYRTKFAWSKASGMGEIK